MATTNYKFLATSSFHLADTITALQDDVLYLDTTDTTGATLTTVATSDLTTFFIAKENCGSSTTGDNAKVEYEFYCMGPIVLLNTAGAVTIQTNCASSSTAGKVSTGTGSAADYTIGIFMETLTAAGKAKVMICPFMS